MDLNSQKEEFSYAYIYAVASTAGHSFQLTSRQLDREGIDVMIAGGTEGGGLVEYPRLDLQIKCTSVDVLGDDFITYPLEIKSYNDLRREHLLVPRILVVVLVPDDIEQWLHQSSVELCMRHCAYWVSLRGEPATENKKTVTVYLPCENVFAVNSLKRLMQLIETGGTL